MWRIILIASCALWGAQAEVSSNDEQKPDASSYAGSYAGSSGGAGGYAGNYNDYDNAGYAPNFDFGNVFFDSPIFHQQLTANIMAQNAAHQDAIASTIATGDATVMAGASNLPSGTSDYDEFINRQQAAIFENINRHNEINYNENNGQYGPSYSSAAASFGPDGVYQTAFIDPPNPDIPNISNRFSPSSPGGFKGVSVSSYISSSNINGKKTSHRGAQTTINDNGRITTYKVNS